MKTTRLLVASMVLAVPAMAWVGCGGDGTDTGPETTTGSTTTGSTTSTTTTSSTGGGSGGSGGQGGAGGGTGGVGGIGGGGGTPGTDACPVQTLNMAQGESVTYLGTTTALTDDYSSFCGDTSPAPDAPDAVYGFTFTEDGIGTINVKAAAGSALSPAIYLQTMCGVADDASYCLDYFPTEQTLKDYFFAGTYYVVVDGKNGSSGDFELSVALAKPVCGDGVLSLAEEQCDPVPPGPNDGCIDPGQPNECKFEPAPAMKDTCPGEAIAVPAGVTTLLAGDGHTTIGYANDYDGSCTLEPGGSDRVYEITPQADGLLTVKIGYEADGTTAACGATIDPPSCWDQVLYLRSTCTDSASELDCGDISWDTPEEVSASVQAGVPVWLFVDGYNDSVFSKGTYNLRIELN